jgi:hypothetical protein
MSPQPERSAPQRRQSESFTCTKTYIGVRGVRGRCSSEILAKFIEVRTMAFSHFFGVSKSVASSKIKIKSLFKILNYTQVLQQAAQIAALQNSTV